MTAKPRPLLLLALAGLVALGAAGCGGSDDGTAAGPPTTAATTTPTTAAATQACADVAALRASLARLDQLDVEAVGRAGLQSALQDVRSSLAAVAASPGAPWAAQATELDGAIDELETTVAGLDSDNLVGELPTIVRNLERIDTASTDLERQVDQACP